MPQQQEQERRNNTAGNEREDKRRMEEHDAREARRTENVERTQDEVKRKEQSNGIQCRMVK